MHRFPIRAFLLALVFMGGSSFSAVVEAGVLVAPSISWSNFSYQPEADEKTPNYFGIGYRLNLGYSVAQSLDLGVFVDYVPGNLGEPKSSTENAQLVSYGLELAGRISGSLYLGLAAGSWNYHLVRQDEVDEIPGRWQGFGGEVAIGGILAASKSSFWQVGLRVGAAVMEPAPGNNLDSRRLDKIAFSVTYVFNGFGKLPIFSRYLKSVLS